VGAGLSLERRRRPHRRRPACSPRAAPRRPRPPHSAAACHEEARAGPSASGRAVACVSEGRARRKRNASLKGHSTDGAQPLSQPPLPFHEVTQGRLKGVVMIDTHSQTAHAQAHFRHTSPYIHKPIRADKKHTPAHPSAPPTRMNEREKGPNTGPGRRKKKTLKSMSPPPRAPRPPAGPPGPGSPVGAGAGGREPWQQGRGGPPPGHHTRPPRKSQRTTRPPPGRAPPPPGPPAWQGRQARQAPRARGTLPLSLHTPQAWTPPQRHPPGPASACRPAPRA